MYPTTIIDRSIAARAWKMALSKSFTLNTSCPEWFKRNLLEVALLVKNKFNNIKA